MVAPRALQLCVVCRRCRCSTSSRCRRASPTTLTPAWWCARWLWSIQACLAAQWSAREQRSGQRVTISSSDVWQGRPSRPPSQPEAAHRSTECGTTAAMQRVLAPQAAASGSALELGAHAAELAGGPAGQDAAAGGSRSSGPLRRCKVVHAWSAPVSPHLAVAREGAAACSGRGGLKGTPTRKRLMPSHRCLLTRRASATRTAGRRAGRQRRGHRRQRGARGVALCLAASAQLLGAA